MIGNHTSSPARSNHSGVSHWKWQRISAVALLPLSLWLMFGFFPVLALDAVAAKAWMASGWNALGLGLWLVVAAFHAILGVQVVIEDYVSDVKVRHATILVLKTFLLVGALAGIFVVLHFGL